MILKETKSSFFRVAKMGGLGMFIFSFQFLHAFGLSIYLPISFLIAVSMLLVHFTTGIPKRHYIQKEDVFLLGTVVCGILPFLVFWKQSGIHNVLYSAAWLVVPLIYFFGSRIWFHASKIKLDQIGHAAVVSVIFLSISIIIEFYLANTTGHYISDFIPFSISKFPEAYVLGDLYLRPRGFTSEAGFSAVIFEALIPLSLFYLRNDKWKRYFFLLVVIPGYLLLFSAASFICIFVAFSILVAFSSKNKIYRLAYLAIFAVGILLSYIFISSFKWYLDQIMIRKIMEFSLPGVAVYSSVTPETFSRLEVYSLGLKLISRFPYGIGWGMLSQMNASGVLLPEVAEVKGSGFISMPLEIFVSSGLIGGGMFMFFVIRKIRRVLRSMNEIKPYLFMALVSVSLHHVAIMEFWFPMFWFLLALSDYINNRKTWNYTPDLLQSTVS